MQTHSSKNERDEWKVYDVNEATLMPVYHCHKPVFRPKTAIFWRAGMREGGLPLPLAFQYLIFMKGKAWGLNLAMISWLAL